MDADISRQDPPDAESQPVAISPQISSNSKETYKYQYSPLKIQSHFRLIAFPREEQVDPRAERLNCELAHFSLDDTAPRYRALSYEWGIPSDKDPRIWINGMPHIIRKNLFCAMLELHSGQRGKTKYGTPYWIWIDALCINQEDLLERNEQVSMMGRIYGSAESVIIWLGVAKDDSDIIMDILGENHDPQLMHRLSHEEKKDALSLWLQRPYWNRIWIVQEIQRGRELEILCGNKAISWGQLINPKALRSMTGAYSWVWLSKAYSGNKRESIRRMLPGLR
ncbi:hypothetical protein HYALB_00002914 [Hymenoscyphus albidus]|uniref:Heterokaryon incompatibility domain-containing protein n=1 Tax=Hymenoscyphus albidus TaxID=595503 RepID=A0A9N9M2I2_9HELO|nr:hypothetical protein HYALB_00002914 [Hymenoscyphus albidus]